MEPRQMGLDASLARCGNERNKCARAPNGSKQSSSVRPPNHGTYVAHMKPLRGLLTFAHDLTPE